MYCTTIRLNLDTIQPYDITNETSTITQIPLIPNPAGTVAANVPCTCHLADAMLQHYKSILPRLTIVSDRTDRYCSVPHLPNPPRYLLFRPREGVSNPSFTRSTTLTCHSPRREFRARHAIIPSTIICIVNLALQRYLNLLHACITFSRAE